VAGGWPANRHCMATVATSNVVDLRLESSETAFQRLLADSFEIHHTNDPFHMRKAVDEFISCHNDFGILSLLRFHTDFVFVISDSNPRKLICR